MGQRSHAFVRVTCALWLIGMSASGFAFAVLPSSDVPPAYAPPPYSAERDGLQIPLATRLLSVDESDRHHIGDPTDEEQLLVELVNRARADTAAEARMLADTDDPHVLNAIRYFNVDLDEMIAQFTELASPLPPLVINDRLTLAARLHSQDMFDQVFQGHASSSTPPPPFEPHSSPSQRVNSVGGYAWIGVSENVYARAISVFHSHAGFQIDWGPGTWHGMQEPPGHRLTIHHPDRRDIGVGIHLGSNSMNGTNVGPVLVTQMFGTQANADPMVTGVAYYDVDGDGAYGIGEGLGQIVVTSDAGPAWAKTTSSGGFAFPVPGDGTYDVTFSFSGFPDLQRSVVVSGGGNRKVDLALDYEPPDMQGPASTELGVLTTYEIAPVFGATDYKVRVYRADETSWVEGAEQGDAFVSIEQSSGYSMIQDALSASGNHAFHFVHPQASANEILYIDRTLLVSETSVLRFDSRLGVATTNQIAAVEIWAGGQHWVPIYSQAGPGSTGEGGFSARTIALSDFAGQAVRIRFRYEHRGGAYFPQTGINFGWVVDTIRVTDSRQLIEIQDEPTNGLTEYRLELPTEGTYYMQARPLNLERELPAGALFGVTAVAPPPLPYLELDALARSHGSGGSVNQRISVQSSISWTATRPASDAWITIMGDATGTGDGHVTYDVAANPGDARSGTIMVTGGGMTRTFTVNQAEFDATMSPAGGVTVETRRPVFTWSATDDATWYQLMLHRDGATHLTQWVQAVTWTPEVDLPAGDYQWRVRGWGSEIGFGEWSRTADFTVARQQPVTAPVQTGPTGEITETRRPAFAWNAVEHAVWYRVFVQRVGGGAVLDRWTQDTTLMPPSDLAAGTYRWWIVAWGPDGYGPWSGSMEFSIPSRAPGAITLIGPQGEQASHDLTYRWEQDANATWYRLWVGRAGAGTWHDGWHAFAGAGTAEVALANHPGGTFAWWLRPWGPDGYGPWSGPGQFTTPAQAPSPPVLVAPLGETFENPPVFDWESERAEWYRVYVQRIGGGAVLDQWTADATLTPAAALPAGQYAWWVGAWNRVTGRVVWSQRGDFTIQSEGHDLGGL